MALTVDVNVTRVRAQIVSIGIVPPVGDMYTVCALALNAVNSITAMRIDRERNFIFIDFTAKIMYLYHYIKILLRHKIHISS